MLSPASGGGSVDKLLTITLEPSTAPSGAASCLTLDGVLVSLNYRDENELSAVLSALGDNVPAEPNAVNPIELGVPLFDLSSRPKSRALANQVERGGFKDVLLLISQLQEIGQNDAAARNDSEQRLVAWMRK